MKKHLTLMAAASLMALAGTASANEFEPAIRDLYAQQIRAWLGEAAVIEAVKAQNEKNASLSEQDIEALDQQWRAEAKNGGGPLVDATLANTLSAFLKQKQDASDGLFTEIFVMDNRGLNVGQSAVTSDYMQGDEAKWQKTFQAGPDGLFLDEVEFDDSSETFQSQLSATLVDPASGTAIGAITVGVNVEKL